MTNLERSPTLRGALPFVIAALLATGVWLAGESRAADHAVQIRDFTFQPAEIQVRTGDSVTWTNGDGEAHAVQGGPMNSPDMAPGQTFTYTFDEPGTVDYFCRLHTYMTGRVVASDDAATTTTTAPPSTTTTVPDGTTTTTAPDGTTTTTVPDGTTTTTTVPDGTTTTTTAPPPPPGDGPGFQEVPDDPSATYPPGTPGSRRPPPATAPPSTTTTTTPPSPPPGFQDVPDDPNDEDSPMTRFRAASAATAVVDGEGGAGPSLGDGTQLAPYTVDGGVKVFRLHMAPTTVTVSPGVTKPAYAFNGLVPGPVLRMNEGDKVRILVDNDLPFPTSVHWHGMILPNEQDGVGGLTQPHIEPGERYTYEWTAVATGTHWYHAHSSGRHIGKGLYGVLEVVPKVGEIDADRDYRVMLGDTDLGFVLNGRSFPSTPTLVAAVGEKIRLRLVNTGDQVHAMHLHGVPFEVVAQDGNPISVPQKMDTLTIAPGQTFDLVATQVKPGKWLLHCHMFIHSHMNMDEHPPGETGMNGMTLVLDIKPSGSALPVAPLGVSQPTGTEQPATPDLELASLLGGGRENRLVLYLVVALLAVAVGRRRLLIHSIPPRKDQTT